MPDVPEATTLDQLPHDSSGTIDEILGEDGVSIRLMEMGLVAGEVVRCVGRAPLGDPIEYEVRGYHISLRSSEAARIRLTS